MKSSQADHCDERELAVRRLNFSLTSPIFSHFCDCVWASLGYLCRDLLAAHYEVLENSLLVPAARLRLPSTEAVKGSSYKGLDFFLPKLWW